jgi:hypothetical protein
MYATATHSADGIGLAAAGNRAPLYLQPAGTAGPPATPVHFRGELYVDSLGVMFQCVTAGTDAANPAVWRRVTTAAPGYDNNTSDFQLAGSVNLLAKPIRLYDTRSPASSFPAPAPATRGPLAPPDSVDIQVTGVSVGGISIPAGAVGVIGSLTVTNTQALPVNQTGYLSIFRQGGGPPITGNVAWVAAHSTVSTFVVSAVNPTNGQVTVQNGALGGSSPTDFVFNAVGFVM